ncbi:MAG: hypothetical protein AB7O52_07015 [Planctomycetota bacterium]
MVAPRSLFALVLSVAILGTLPCAGQLVPGTSASDPALVVTGSDLVVDLSTAGTYDPVHWAVVFHYSSVDVAAGRTVTFLNHPTNAPVVWLVHGDVNIAGTVNLDGKAGGEPGPGGFRGGRPFSNGSIGPGFGPGGGRVVNPFTGEWGVYGGGARAYGSDLVIPLLGGSGGGGFGTASGCGGGGAILIAANGTVTVAGVLRARGGPGGGYAASGGAVRIVAQSVLGSGSIFVRGSSDLGGGGRVALQVSSGAIAPLAVDLYGGNGTASGTYRTDYLIPEPAIIFPPSDAPTVRVSSVGAMAGPADPNASWINPDLAFGTLGPKDVVIETANLGMPADWDPADWQVQLFVRPLNGSEYNVDSVPFTGGNSVFGMWTTSVDLPSGTYTLQARVRRVTP